MEEKKCKLLFKVEGGEDISVFASFGESLLDAAKRANLALDAPCAGNGTCGKCRVKLLAGSVKSEPNRHISPEEFAQGYRLACASAVVSDVTVLVPATARAYQNRIRVSGKGDVRERAVFENLQKELRAMGLEKDSGLELINLEIENPRGGDGMADRERLLRKIAGNFPGSSPLTGLMPDKIGFSLHALRKLPMALRLSGSAGYSGGESRPAENSVSSLTVLLRRESGTKTGVTILDLFPAGAASPPPVIAGLAIDIGTTTVSALMADLLTGEILAAGSAGNGQIRYGADVISRIIESARPGGLERLRRAVTEECLVPLIRDMSKTAGLLPENIYRVAAAANTTMTHLFMGVNPEYLRLEPYVPAFFESGALKSADMNLGVHPDAELILAPAIGSYVGGDISAGVFASMLFKKETLSLFIDLGTNGELALGNSEFLMSCACSAGPAFEGGDISCGMRATDGAIEACRIDADTMEPVITVIGAEGQKPDAAQKAVGICGSGLIDLIGELFRCGIINARGKFIREGKRIRRDEWGGASYVAAFARDTANGRDVALSEADIDNFIRAKGAIFSAIRTMLAVLDLGVEAIDDVYVAGGIGGGINMGQAIRIGMFPKLPAEKYHYIGNSSLHGAYAMLTARRAGEMVVEISRGMTYLELSTHPGYMDEFVAACFLPHTNGALFAEGEAAT
ncbi:ferredoxin [Spirochaetia bacterium]|nr:ferredoxin [Spirochaetia bacterium]